MKRRNFLSGAAAASLAALTARGSLADAVASTDRPLGRPNYLDDEFKTEMNQLRLSLHRGDVPIEVWEDIVTYQTAWQSLKKDPESKALFYEDPSRWLGLQGIPDSVIDYRDKEVRLLQAIYAHPDILSVAGDYNAFARYIASHGIVDPSAPQRMSTKIKTAVRQQREEIERMLEKSGLPKTIEFSDDMPLYEIEQMVSELNNIASETNSSPDAVVVLNVAVAVNIATAVNVAIALALAVAIAVVVTVEVVVYGEPDNVLTAANNPLLKKLAALDEDTRVNLSNGLRAARLADQPEYAVEILRDFIASETRVVLEACEMEGIIVLPSAPLDRERYFELSGRLANKVIGGPELAAAA